ncbi:MFS transporter [Burkholderia pseudomallei]|uniref:MFS transporter n=1 Tax=Burkholderia pseudomallei TaxID=28450 RepID=UPI000536A930|nr:MFS transporter [Burkholderia pseudomallei]KGU71278.1 major Facilitator Superfamily protein [Burkholderia pseudomallei MSHR4304]KGV30747.1 major Facilitator Superfamily protein [Burkholderia pseudomallei MSHR4308]KGW06366.1 major Facilitator Superfamily protein [Burkholderia pseudomallei MSHR4303]ONC62720.1 MFS transporter [Burkholderia pseudomallei]
MSTHTPRPRAWLTPSLGLTQIVGWGSMFYAYGVLMQPMQDELVLSKHVVVGAYSVALLISGLFSTSAGSIIDRVGGRVLMASGSLLAAFMLACLSRVHSVAGLYLMWAGIGVAMSATLYQPAFAVITQVFGGSYRRAITHLTLFGGFASTVFWPLTQSLLQHIGWRETWLLYAAANLLVCLPIHATVPKRDKAAHEPSVAHTEQSSASLTAVLRAPAFYMVTAAVTLNALVFAAMSLHMIPVLQAHGISAANAAWVGALVGPMQVLGRVLETTVGKRASTSQVGMAAIALLPLSLILLFVSGKWLPVYVVFAALYGISNGVMTIVRGALPAELYGRAAYGAISGAMATPVQIAIAAGPFVASLLYAAGNGYPGTLLALAGIGATGAILFRYAILHLRHRAIPLSKQGIST